MAVEAQSGERDKVLKPIRELLQKFHQFHPIFESLNTEDKNIGDILAQDRTGQLRAYWFENKDFPKEPENNDKIINIIRQNLQRITTRNIALGNIGTIIKGQYENIPIIDLRSGRRVVFLSSTGNRLIELLEDRFFPDYTFITFDRPYMDEKSEPKSYDGFLKGNLGYILSHMSDRIPPTLKEKSEGYKKELVTYLGALKDLTQRHKAYDECVNKLTANVPKPLEARPITESALRTQQTAQSETLRLTAELDTKLQQLQASLQASLRLIPDFYHSEQLLRLFLYNNLELLVKKYFKLEDIEQFLTLHIHSSNDVCERCAHCLFLESEMCNVITEESRSFVKKAKGESAKDPYGFFEKFYNSVKGIKPDLKYQVLVTSSSVGEQRGVQHRYQSGHDMSPSSPIQLDRFPPLLAFQVIPSTLHLRPLPPTLAQSQLAATGLLQQTYFPTGNH
jgi:hypothetical protein